jgi:hypothetical protein
MNTQFTNEEHAVIYFVYGFCDGNTWPAVVEYRRLFPNRRYPSRAVFSSVYQRFRDTGSFITRTRERGIKQRVRDHEQNLLRVKLSPTASVRQIPHQILTQPQTRRNTSLLIYCSLATRFDIYAGIPGT